MTKLKIFIIRQLVKLYYKFKFKIVVNFNDFNHKRTDPYFLIGNHSFLHDGLIHSMYLKRYPYPIINAFMFTNEKMKYILTKVIYSIPKRKGQVDIGTIREMMNVVKKKKRGIMLFPEGNSSCFGKESDFPFSTVKLFKKFKIDVVVVKTNGAYLTSPRWGLKPTKKGLIEQNYHTLFKGNELENYSEEEIYQVLKEALAFNDFDWNRERKHLYSPKERALGLETYIYFCPKCHKHQTISTKGNQIYCDHCGEIAHFNAYSLLSGLEFDNLIEWNDLQKRNLPKILENIIYTSGNMYKVDMTTYTLEEEGRIDIEINPFSKSMFVQNKDKETVFDIDKIIGLTLTRKKEISFDYKKSTFLFKLDDPMIVLDSINYLKEDKQ